MARGLSSGREIACSDRYVKEHFSFRHSELICEVYKSSRFVVIGASFLESQDINTNMKQKAR